jgi:cadmium resistance protein CadD (predicted permease)
MQFIVTSIIAFISTNIDDTFILMLFFGNRKFSTREIILGQFLGIGTLITVSLVLSLIGLVVGKAYIGFLGVIPIYLGLRGVIYLFKKKVEEDENPVGDSAGKSNVMVVAGVTIANGGDNVGIYVPLFAALEWTHKITMISVFLIMTGVLCIAARYLTAHPFIAKGIERYGHLITPFVLILLGAFIIYESGTLSLFSL